MRDEYRPGEDNELAECSVDHKWIIRRLQERCPECGEQVRWMTNEQRTFRCPVCERRTTHDCVRDQWGQVAAWNCPRCGKDSVTL